MQSTAKWAAEWEQPAVKRAAGWKESQPALKSSGRTGGADCQPVPYCPRCFKGFDSWASHVASSPTCGVLAAQARGDTKAQSREEIAGPEAAVAEVTLLSIMKKQKEERRKMHHPTPQAVHEDKMQCDAAMLRLSQNIHREDLMARDECGHNAMHHAIQNGWEDVVYRLCDLAPELANQTTRHEGQPSCWTPLHMVTQSQKGGCSQEARCRMARRLMQVMSGDGIRAKTNPRGRNALHLACATGSHKLIEIITGFNVIDKTEVDDSGMNPDAMKWFRAGEEGGWRRSSAW